MTSTENVHEHEIHKFGVLADRWWDLDGEFKTLHAVNPLRIQFIRSFAELEGKRVVDVGCGGGILSEGLARAGAQVVGIDLAEELLDIAKSHADESGIEADYRRISAEALAEAEPGSFDIVTCMEMLEHVPDPASVVRACAKLVKPGGRVFFSTLNRKLKAYLLAIVGAEYLLNMIPKGTHDYATFIKPSELSRWAREAGLELLGMEGIAYNPITGQFTLSRDLDVNYLAAFARPEE
ncbi:MULTISPECIES: bifunctional 2-polyprenyl-6-hydroxyphenol methylase/3-demethylubiquinol 3-O-methyltransferase UbiG [unclassified Methylocaldum]|jgi:2-polyprenyl-6-hydroxyphenyl methylase/3-demethylubiquinone-9 3-methyltransferase|uniref:bifunctional 2-polyprenyl-6-hydroxyphenol methylase/3-demethylubiquinol 3-O-methyltransferase UbiG n=1 Tax=unclassified Methylocaldum TaxID=2622260 RepID=UPI000A320DE4|nr:bifunctional 2-polyprenyl-6-hydroxyphenol methylase/3-demethylubiquinol 3-O-methyltransferase UbiG [Methylocaldum sp. RMAD-M]MBP1148837.1 2-polyprenyl-6-hydroxyphenyl methylase/3-demethylubiquinone-9 3-methyltransferase [Methylocaldum sp. RMAD-M]MDV3243271.1 bifunctional 2-polyprenyl-6-hydroxyphenol methylase/3-demethylubiquinol 3-O-methyltransferase UbiG [Methylocaldum sp.]